MPNFEDGALNIGNLGELEFSKWCTSARLNVNRSLEEDSTGWDHIVRLPYEKTHLPKDKQEKPIECKVQVKTSFQEDKKGVSIKLSALKHLVDYTSPAFILFYEYTNKEDPELLGAYLVHLGQKLIKKILKRVREEHLAAEPKELHKIKLWISYTDNDKVPSNSGRALRDTIASYVPDGIVAYQKEKDSITKNVGYENDGYILQFEARPEDMEQHFIDAVVGRSTSVDITNSVLKDNRFNIPRGAVEIKSSDIAKIEVFPTLIDGCQLSFRASQYSPPITFESEFVKIPQLDKAKNTLCFKTKLFSIEIGELFANGKMDSRLHFLLDKEVELDEIIKLLKLFSSESLGKELKLEAKFKNENRVLNLSTTLNTVFEESLMVVDSTSVIRNKYHIDGKTLTTFDELYNQRVALSALAAFIENKFTEIRFKAVDSDPDNLEITIPYTMTVKIGASHVGIVALLDGVKSSELESDYQATNVDIIEYLTFVDSILTKELLKEVTDNALRLRADKIETLKN